MSNDHGEHAGEQRGSSEPKRECEQACSSEYEHPDARSQEREVQRSDERPRGKPSSRSQGQQTGLNEIEARHCLCIHVQADQKPAATPSASNAALQKMRVPKL